MLATVWHYRWGGAIHYYWLVHKSVEVNEYLAKAMSDPPPPPCIIQLTKIRELVKLPMRHPKGACVSVRVSCVWLVTWSLALTRCCHYQYCMVYGI